MAQGSTSTQGKAGPVGQGSYEVGAHECLLSISEKSGFFWKTIWDDPANSALRDARKDPRVLLAGDLLTIPEKRLGEESGVTEKRHRFRRKGVPVKLRLQFCRHGQPRANVSWLADIEGQIQKGSTDDQGMVEITIPNGAETGKISVGAGDETETFELQLGHLDPFDSISGVQMRLNNLGYSSGQPNGEFGPRTEAALRDFQKAQGLEVSGSPDEVTCEKLRKVHGS
jgi:N-acetylmuramoyl-L-alanine amidase